VLVRPLASRCCWSRVPTQWVAPGGRGEAPESLLARQRAHCPIAYRPGSIFGPIRCIGRIRRRCFDAVRFRGDPSTVVRPECEHSRGSFLLLAELLPHPEALFGGADPSRRADPISLTSRPMAHPFDRALLTGKRAVRARPDYPSQRVRRERHPGRNIRRRVEHGTGSRRGARVATTKPRTHTPQRGRDKRHPTRSSRAPGLAELVGG
jgi:hypothetical protein